MTAALLAAALLVGQTDGPIQVRETDEYVAIETDAIQAKVNKKGYVSGIAAGSLLDKKTGARDLGFGLHIMDFLLGPGWKDDGYSRDRMVHGEGREYVPGKELGFFQRGKHYVEGPQICTQAKQLDPQVIRGKDFVAVKMKYRFHKSAKGFKAGSLWEQTLVFQPGVRYFLCSEQVTSANDVDNVLYRIDMPGHVRHTNGDNFEQIYLSYRGLIPAKEFSTDFAPDEKFLYQRKEGHVPQRFIRAYQVKRDGQPGPWLAGMTLDPAAVVEAWCHQRGYVCFIEELHGKRVRTGETFGAAYVVGWFDDVADMERTYDRYRAASRIEVGPNGFQLK